MAGHRLLADRARHDLGYRSIVLADVASTAPLDDRLVILTGPRRVGKSVALLDVAAALCRRADIDPRQVVHLPCNGFASRDLRRALTLGRELTRVVDQTSPARRVWLLDEVSAISGWTAVLKTARDGTAFGDDTAVAAGSRWSASDDVEGNLLARRGPGRLASNTPPVADDVPGIRRRHAARLGVARPRASSAPPGHVRRVHPRRGPVRPRRLRPRVAGLPHCREARRSSISATRSSTRCRAGSTQGATNPT